MLWPCLFMIGATFPAALAASGMNPAERAIYRLQNLVNEFELLIRNGAADQADLRRQQKEIDFLRVHDRIPFKPEIAELERHLKASAKASGLEVISSRVIPISARPRAIPRWVRSDRPFRFSDDQLLEVIPLEVRIRGPVLRLRRWICLLPELHVRIVEGNPREIRAGGPGGELWILTLRTFRFREVRFPTIRPLDPRGIPLGSGAGQVAEIPTVKELIHRARALRGRVAPFYQTRGKLLLNAARMRVFARRAQNELCPPATPEQ